MGLWAGVLDLINDGVTLLKSYHVVPGADGSDNALLRDVVGNKTDARVYDGSLIAIAKQIEHEAYETEHHLHNFEKWFGKAAAADAELHVADRMDGAILPFTLVAGNSAFGNWVQILGSADTPVNDLTTKFDLHRALITDTNSTNPFIIQIITGESAGVAAKLLAEDFDEFPYVSATNNNDSGISDVLDKRCDVNEKVWARCACVGASGTTLDLYFGIHEYIR